MPHHHLVMAFQKYPTKESSKISTKYPYAFTKNVGEAMMIHWNQVYKLKTFTARLFNVLW